MIERDLALVDVGRGEPQRLTAIARAEQWLLLEEFVAPRPVRDHPNDHRHGDAGATDARNSPMIRGSTLIRRKAMGTGYGTGCSGPLGGIVAADLQHGESPVIAATLEARPSP